MQGGIPHPFSCDSNSPYIMPKEYRPPSNAYRLAPVPLPSDVSGTRVTTIWTQEEDDVLMSARAKGLSWAPIATQYFPSKTANACRKRHERLMERRNAEDWDGVKLETLAREYMAVRREMWSILADRVGEKWQIIENKVL
jgi:Myb-like DNA-binding domain